MSNYFASGLPYSRKLVGHSSCVNTLAFSSGEGRWLASAGDDRVVNLWDLHQEDVTASSFSFGGHSRNVSTVAFSASNQYVYSGGADQTILKYDLTRYTTNQLQDDGPTQTYAQHSDHIRSVSCHPYQDEIFLSASMDGCVMIHDGRAGSPMTHAEGTLQQAAGFSSAIFNPRMEHLFVTSDERGNVCLRDTRMAFGPLHQRTKKGMVLKFVSRITERSVAEYIRPDASSVTWDADGTKLGVTLLHWLPTIYSLSDPYPVAVCSGRNLPDGTPSPTDARTFSDSVTMKHGSFGGSAQNTGGEAYYSSGSDDFRGYLWKIPPLSTLENERRVISADDWQNGAEDGVAAFTGSSHARVKYVPKELSTPLTRLCGHLSIVNNALIHPVFPLIATAGIERQVSLHSPTPSTPWASNLPLTPTTTRSLPTTPVDPSVVVEADVSLREEAYTIAYFDRILQREGERDVFALTKEKPAVPSDDDEDDGHDVGIDPAAAAET